MKSPRISILLATFNGEKFIAQTIDSVIAQSYKDWELIIEDGNSTDGTVDIIRKYAENNLNIKLVSELDEGQGHAMAKAAIRATGEFLMILAASDGYLDMDWLSRCINMMDSDQDLSVVWGIPFTLEADNTMIPHFAYSHFLKNGEGRVSLMREIGRRLFHPSSFINFFKKGNALKLSAAAEMLKNKDVPQKEEWFSYWLKTGLIFPDGNMCIARYAYFDCMPPYMNGTKDQIDWMGFFFALNSKGYLAHCIPVGANFARADHEGQLGRRIIEFTKKNRADYYEKLERFKKGIIDGTIDVVFLDRLGNPIKK